MSWPTSYDNIPQPVPTTLRAVTVGVSPANTVAQIIQSLQLMQWKLGLNSLITFTADSGTDTLTSAGHGLSNGDVVIVESTGTLPGGLAVLTKYFVIGSTTNTFQLATSYAGSAIDLTSNGTGTNSFILILGVGRILTGAASGVAAYASALSGLTLTAPVFSGSITGTYTLAGTPTLTSPTINTPTISAPVLSGTATGTYTLAGTPTITSPTITTPTIASFTNATHTHTNAAGGGVLTYAALSPGAVAQVVSTAFTGVATGTTVIPYDDSTPQNTEGDQYMTQEITPKSATNTLVIEATLLGGSSVISNMIIALFQDSTANALAVGVVPLPAANGPETAVLFHTMVAGTTSATTFKIRACTNDAGTFTFNGFAGVRKFGGITLSGIKIMEYNV